MTTKNSKKSFELELLEEWLREDDELSVTIIEEPEPFALVVSTGRRLGLHITRNPASTFNCQEVKELHKLDAIQSINSWSNTGIAVHFSGSTMGLITQPTELFYKYQGSLWSSKPVDITRFIHTFDEFYLDADGEDGNLVFHEADDKYWHEELPHRIEHLIQSLPEPPEVDTKEVISVLRSKSRNMRNESIMEYVGDYHERWGYDPSEEETNRNTFSSLVCMEMVADSAFNGVTHVAHRVGRSGNGYASFVQDVEIDDPTLTDELKPYILRALYHFAVYYTTPSDSLLYDGGKFDRFVRRYLMKHGYIIVGRHKTVSTSRARSLLQH